MVSKILAPLIIGAVTASIACFIFWNRTKDSPNKVRVTAHRILSTLINLSFIAALVIGLWGINRYFVLLVPCVLLIIYPLSWGVNTELSEEDMASLVIIRGCRFLHNNSKFRAGCLRLITFAPYYLIAAWKQKAR